MDLYEYQARDLLAGHDVPFHASILLKGADADLSQLLNQPLTYPQVVKAQVKIGGRGKAGGVKLVQNDAELSATVKAMFGMDLKGHVVERVLLVPAAQILQEYYVSITFDRGAGQYLLLLSKYGGVDIEELSASHPEDLTRYHFSPLVGLTQDMCYSAARIAGFEGDILDQCVIITMRLWAAYQSADATLVEVNPLALCLEGDTEKVYALDAKVSLDDSAQFRQSELFARYEAAESQDAFSARAKSDGLAYVRLDGSVGVIGNGAGLVMSTLDIVEQVGSSFEIRAANFLDIGGGASLEHMQNALSLILSDEQVECVFINIFGGLTQCTLVAGGIIAALENIHADASNAVKPRPLVVRFAGNEAEAGLKLLGDARLENVHVYDDQIEAARKAVEIAHQARTGGGRDKS